MQVLGKFFFTIWTEAHDNNTANIISLLETDPHAKALDVGCGDGQKTALFQEKIGAKEITGIDGVKGRLNAAKNRKVKIVFSDLEKKWPFSASSFDVVISNQVIEHIVDIDHFIEETHRILKPGGYCVISTENLSSWHNIFALVLGFQDFSHHIIKKKHITNPISPHYGKKTATWSKEDNSGVDDATFPHIKIMTYRSLRNIFETYNFIFEIGRGSGYYPFFGRIGKLASFFDPYHSHFITIKMRKPLSI